MNNNFPVSVSSEIGELEGVIIHTPGREVEDMTPQNVERALYSDILNRPVVTREYAQFSGILKKVSRVFEVKELLKDIASQPPIRSRLVDIICQNEKADCLKKQLLEATPQELAAQLIEGIPLKKDNLSKFLSQERYSLQPLHNFFFTRDAAAVVNSRALIARMANPVREREAIIMEFIFNHHPLLMSDTLNPIHGSGENPAITLEGGDIIIARQDILLIGIGKRTSMQGVDFVIDILKNQSEPMHLLVQELPKEPESFIHLDMVFTLVDMHHCVIYQPVVLNPSRFRTVHIHIEQGEVVMIREEKNLLDALHTLDMELTPIICGGRKDEWIQEREQWHSGANFLSIAPGKVIGYGQNIHTMEELNRHGFEILKARDILSGHKNLGDYRKCVITIEGSELSRGGGGCRCMSLPVRRKPVS